MKKNTTGIYCFFKIILILTILSSCSETQVKQQDIVQDPFSSKIDSKKGEIRECYKNFSYLESVIIYFNVNKKAQIENIAAIPALSIPVRQCLSLVLLSIKFNPENIMIKRKFRIKITL